MSHHTLDTVGDIIIEDSTFAYQGDDGLNIHGAIGGTAKAGEDFLHWTVGGEGSWAPYGWAKDDLWHAKISHGRKWAQL